MAPTGRNLPSSEGFVKAGDAQLPAFVPVPAGFALPVTGATVSDDATGGWTALPPGSVTVVIPCLNEAPIIAATVHEIADRLERLSLPGFEILVIDDGSKDKTAWQASAAGARVLLLPQHFGKGMAVRVGLSTARGEYVLIVDADLALGSACLENMVQILREGTAEAVLGTRCGTKPAWFEIKEIRWWASQGFMLFTRLLLFDKRYDTQCGCKGLNLWRLRPLLSKLTGGHFAVDLELLLLLQHGQRRIAWLPVRVVRHRQDSRVSLFRDGWKLLRDVWQLRRKFS